MLAVLEEHLVQFLQTVEILLFLEVVFLHYQLLEVDEEHLEHLALQLLQDLAVLVAEDQVEEFQI